MINNIADLQTPTTNTWCPGCGNFPILAACKQAFVKATKNDKQAEDLVVVSGIGCGSKIIDYLNLNTFSALHGRPVASAQGVKLGNPNLEVMVVAGDGGQYNEGLSHLIHAAKRNIDITVLIQDNHTFALTTGQFTATSPTDFTGPSTPNGSPEEPFNPLAMMHEAGATFIARSYAFKTQHLLQTIEAALQHKGFSFIEVLQPCHTFYNTTQIYNQKTYELTPNQSSTQDREEALRKIHEWDYGGQNQPQTKIPLGIFHQEQKPTFEIR